MIDLVFLLLIAIILAPPFLLTIWNTFTFIFCLVQRRDTDRARIMEGIAMIVGLLYTNAYLSLFRIAFEPWDAQLYPGDRNGFIAPDAIPTVLVLLLAALVGYIALRFFLKYEKSPVASTAGISAVYLGIGACILLCIQVSRDFFLILLPANCILIFVKSIFLSVVQRGAIPQYNQPPAGHGKLSGILNQPNNLPWIALVLTVPLLGILIAVLFLLGEPSDSIITAWTDTVGWFFSQRAAPPNMYFLD